MSAKVYNEILDIAQCPTAIACLRGGVITAKKKRTAGLVIGITFCGSINKYLPVLKGMYHSAVLKECEGIIIYRKIQRIHITVSGSEVNERIALLAGFRIGYGIQRIITAVGEFKLNRARYGF